MQNILVIGLVGIVNEEDWTTEAFTRDNHHIRYLKTKFSTVFSLAKDPSPTACSLDLKHHVVKSLDKEGAQALVSLMSAHHQGKKLTHVCIEYVRLPASYYRPFIIGGVYTIESTAGSAMIEFMQILNEHDKLAAGCVL